jgi:hypothetical protein
MPRLARPIRIRQGRCRVAAQGRGAKPIEWNDDETLLLADVGRKAIRQVRQMTKHLLEERRLAAEQASNLAGKW